MAEIKSYSDYSIALLMGDKERIITSILRQLFEGIYNEFKNKCTLEEVEKTKINEFLFWPEGHELVDTASFFTNEIYANKTMQRVTNNQRMLFSIKGLLSKMTHPAIRSNSVERRRITKQLETKEKFKFSIEKMQEVGSICSELVRLRNLAAHSSGLQNTSQALLLLSNILRLLNLTPDEIRKSTKDFDYLENHLQKDFLDSILSVMRPDIEEEVDELNQKILARKTKDKTTLEEILESKVDRISNQIKDLNDLKNINNSVADNQASINEILLVVKDLKVKGKGDTKKSISKGANKSSFEQKIVYKEFGGSLSRSEAYDKLMKLRVQIKKEMSQTFLGFRKNHNILDEPIAKAMLNEEISSLKALKASSIFKNVLKFNKLSYKELKPLDNSKNLKEDYMELEIKIYWPKIELILNDYFNKK